MEGSAQGSGVPEGPSVQTKDVLSYGAFIRETETPPRPTVSGFSANNQAWNYIFLADKCDLVLSRQTYAMPQNPDKLD